MWKAFVLGFVGALGAGLGAMVFLEVRGVAGWGSGRVVKLAARLLPKTVRSEREEEWLAEYEQWKDAAVDRLLWALGLLVASLRIAHGERRSVEQSAVELQSAVEPQSVAEPPAAAHRYSWWRGRFLVLGDDSQPRIYFAGHGSNPARGATKLMLQGDDLPSGVDLPRLVELVRAAPGGKRLVVLQACDPILTRQREDADNGDEELGR